MPSPELLGIAGLTEPFFFPWIASHVVSAPLPKARLVTSHELNALDPLGALPGVEPGNHKAKGPAMLRWNGLTVVSIRKKSVFGQEVVERQVGGPVAIVGVDQHIARLR